MPRHPSERFIKFLMTPPNSFKTDDAWVGGMMTSLGFPPPDPAYLAALRYGLNQRIPATYQPGNRYHRASTSFLKEEGLYGLTFRDKATMDAQLIVTNLRARPIVEQLLLGRMEPREIAKRVNARLNEYLTAESVQAFGLYYWDVSLLSVEDWAQLYQDYDVQRANALSIVQVGPSMALHKMGFSQALESKTILKEMLEGLYFDFREWKTQPLSERRTKSMTAIAKAAVMVDDRLSQADSAIKDSLKAFEQFRMKHADQTPKDMKDLAPAGNFSGSGAKLLEEKKQEAGE